MIQAPAAATAVAVQGPPKAKRAATEAMSPGHLASTTALSPVERRLQHAFLGVDKEFRDKVKDAESTLELTKSVGELQHVMRQVVQAVTELQKNTFDQEARMVLAVQRVENIDPKITTLEAADDKIKDDVKGMGDKISERMKEFEREIGGKDKLLYAALAAQEGILTERIEEIKVMFLRCDEVFVKKDDDTITLVAGAKGTTWPPPGTPSISATAMKEILADSALLRGTIDALQIEVNQFRSETLECQDSKVPTEMSLQEFSGQLESFQTWTLQEVL
jgi:hypothetical protein